MAKKNKNKMLLILGAAAIGLFMYKKKKDAANEEFTLPNKTAAKGTQSGNLNLQNLKKTFAKKPINTFVSRSGKNLERIGNFENIQ